MSLQKYLIAFCVLLTLASGEANATIVNFQFAGTVTYGGTLSNVNSQVTGFFSYDTTTAPSNSAGNIYAAYHIETPFSFITVSFPGHTLTSNVVSVAIWNNFGGNIEDSFSIAGLQASIDGILYPESYFGFNLASGFGKTGVLSDTSLPSHLDLSAFDAIGFNYGFLNNTSGTLMQFSINSITAVPIPPSALLMVTGILALFRVRWQNPLPV